MTIGKGFGGREEDKIDKQLPFVLPLIVAERKCFGVVSDLMGERNSFISETDLSL
nr:unnamed protein product [Callosobruchus chinensis]